VDTVTGPQHTPPAKRSNPFLPTNPFAGEAGPAPKKTPWALIIAGLVSVIALALLLAKFTG